MKTTRTALLLSCSKEQAAAIHEKAKSQGRTVSACVLRIVNRWIDLEERLVFSTGKTTRFSPILVRRPAGPRTTMLIRCSREEARRIRAAAKRRDATISAFVLHALSVAWAASGERMID